MEEFNGVAGGMEEASYKSRNIRSTRKGMNNLVQLKSSVSCHRQQHLTLT